MKGPVRNAQETSSALLMITTSTDKPHEMMLRSASLAQSAQKGQHTRQGEVELKKRCSASTATASNPTNPSWVSWFQFYHLGTENLLFLVILAPERAFGISGIRNDRRRITR